ncbi:hypothetical protein D3C80_979460 [compost metagenome]
MQGRQHQMPGQRCLHRHQGGFAVADLADHDDVRVLAQHRPHAVGEAQAQGRLHLQLVERRFQPFDRVFDGAQVDLRGGQQFEAGVERAGLAGTGGARYQDDALAVAQQRPPLLQLLPFEAQAVEAFMQLLRVEQAQHQFFAKRRRQGRQAQLHLAAARQAALQATVLWPAFLRYIHTPQVFEAADQRQGHACGKGVDGVQQAVYAVPQLPLFAAGLQVDIAGALFEGVLQQPVDDVHDMRIVGIGLGLAFAQFQQVFELPQAGRLLVLRTLYRLGQAQERLPQLTDLQRACQHPTDRPAEAAGQVCLPVILIRLGAGHGDARGVGGHDEDAMALGERRGDQPADLGHVQLHRVDAHKGLADLIGQPLTEAVQVQRLAGVHAVFKTRAGDQLQWVAGRACGGLLQHQQGVAGVQVLLGQQSLEQAVEVEGLLAGGMHVGVLARWGVLMKASRVR